MLKSLILTLSIIILGSQGADAWYRPVDSDGNREAFPLIDKIKEHHDQKEEEKKNEDDDHNKDDN